MASAWDTFSQEEIEETWQRWPRYAARAHRLKLHKMLSKSDRGREGFFVLMHAGKLSSFCIDAGKSFTLSFHHRSKRSLAGKSDPTERETDFFFLLLPKRPRERMNSEEGYVCPLMKCFIFVSLRPDIPNCDKLLARRYGKSKPSSLLGNQL